MSIRLMTDKENVDYQAVADILDHFGLSHFDAATEEKINERLDQYKEGV